MKRHPLLNLMWKAIIKIAWASGNKKNDIGTEIPVPFLFYLKTSGYILYYYPFYVDLFVNLSNSCYICLAIYMDVGNIANKGELF